MSPNPKVDYSRPARNHRCENTLQNTFFLTGGTALAVFYLHHRRSNDLVLFTLAPTDLSEIDFSLKSIWKNSYVKIKQSPNGWQEI